MAGMADILMGVIIGKYPDDSIIISDDGFTISLRGRTFTIRSGQHVRSYRITYRCNLRLPDTVEGKSMITMYRDGQTVKEHIKLTEDYALIRRVGDHTYSS